MLACGRTSVCSRWLIVGVSCRLLLVHQTNEEVVAGRFPVGRELAVELCALIAQVSQNLMFFFFFILTVPFPADVKLSNLKISCPNK